MSGLNDERTTERRRMLERFTTFVNNRKSESTETEKEIGKETKTEKEKEIGKETAKETAKEIEKGKEIKETETGTTNDNIDILFTFLKQKTTNQSIKDKLNNVLNILNPGLRS